MNLTSSLTNAISIPTMAATVRAPIQERAKARRAALLLAAQIEFSELGYARTTAKSIAQRAGCATGSFYQYFHDKDAALRELGRERFEVIAGGAMALFADDPREPAPPRLDEVQARMRAVVEAVADYHREDPGLHEVLTERRVHDAELGEHTAAGEAVLVDSIASLLRRWGHPGDAEATAFVLFAMVEGSVHAHVLGHAVVDDARFYAALVDALSRVAFVARPSMT